MKLIKLNTLLDNIERIHDEKKRFNIGLAAQAINETPVIDAIPIEWLEGIVNNEDEYSISFRRHVDSAIRLWRTKGDNE